VQRRFFQITVAQDPNQPNCSDVGALLHHRGCKHSVVPLILVQHDTLRRPIRRWRLYF